jgi:hypothetical protein
MTRLLALVALVATLVIAPSQAAALQDTNCVPGQTPTFVFGFADLKAQIGAAMGEPTTCEFADPNGTGDVHQRTTTGLAFWRKSTNTPTFTNGFDHWAHSPAGWVTWTGASIDPPNVYPEFVVANFLNSCQGDDPAKEAYCQCALDRIRERYSLTEFLDLDDQIRNEGTIPRQLLTVIVECLA